ncbi:rRNA biogenesis protein rrp36 [Aspergillus arachidicola]|uniref:rRNA biogenesis protein RRP36 n=1 Tax=Aspergillus arachidicola TaxID=656916 RepID=A0A2G7G518_9EURO|nr:rRNA biogenesis protein rrp36 [Aspergillus arachidicola]
MAISDLLNRRVRALPEEDEEIYSEESAFEEKSDDRRSGEFDSDSDDLDDEALEEVDDNSEHDGPVGSEDDEDSEDSEDNDNGEDDVQTSLSSISFGALAKAQASLGPKGKRNAKTAKPTEESPQTTSPLDDIRARIREAREQKRQESGKSKDSAKPARTSKHAPMIQSSKRAVSRKRTVVEPPSVPKSRDPRFDPTVLSQGGRHNAESARKAYSFLDDYRQVRQNKDAEEKEALKREIRSTSDRLRAMENRRREEEVLAEHKKREKQLIREGKKSNPYFLKKSDLKKQVMLKKYENMNSKERTKALERRRKKIASKERKEMPMERRLGSEGNDDGGRKRRRMA